MSKIHRIFLWAFLLASALFIGGYVSVTAETSSLYLKRAPYLQMMTSSSVVIRWRTNESTKSRVRYGTSLSNMKILQIDRWTRDHAVRVNNLSAITKHYYSVGTDTKTLAGGDSYHYFYTAPRDTRPVRIWAIGDSGYANSRSYAVREGFRSYTGSKYPNVFLMLGDNAYQSGTDTEYDKGLFSPMQKILRQSPMFPTFGNHDAVSSDSYRQTGPYYSSFSLPNQAQLGGVASNTEAYYSFNYSNIHFICLDSADSTVSSSSSMLTWLKKDIQSANQMWVIAYWHHPPYSKGSHNSDSELRLKQMREKALPILEDGGVDLVLAGHSHGYERSYLIDRHYGSSNTFTSSMKKNGGDGRENGNGAYRKPTAGRAPHQGSVYVVAGNASQVSTTLSRHPAMYTAQRRGGSLVIDVNGTRLDLKFLDEDKIVRDYFTIKKGY